MHRVTIVAAALAVACLAVPSAAQSKNFAEDAVARRRADAESVNKMIDCAVRSRAQDLATWVLATWVLEPGLYLIGLAGFPVLRFRMDCFRWGEVPETSPARGGRSRVGVPRGLAC